MSERLRRRRSPKTETEKGAPRKLLRAPPHPVRMADEEVPPAEGHERRGGTPPRISNLSHFCEIATSRARPARHDLNERSDAHASEAACRGGGGAGGAAAPD